MCGRKGRKEKRTKLPAKGEDEFANFRNLSHLETKGRQLYLSFRHKTYMSSKTGKDFFLKKILVRLSPRERKNMGSPFLFPAFESALLAFLFSLNPLSLVGGITN